MQPAALLTWKYDDLSSCWKCWRQKMTSGSRLDDDDGGDVSNNFSLTSSMEARIINERYDDYYIRNYFKITIKTKNIIGIIIRPIFCLNTAFFINWFSGFI